MKLVIVESPAKAKTIQKYLGRGYTVKSSFGHIRDLPKSKLGVDTKKNYQPQYVIPTRAKKQVAALKKSAAKADEIYYATDEDREGEAIAWHLAELLSKPGAKVKRITFDEITKTAIRAAIKQPRPIDMNLVDAQQARRILDRLVGYELSPLLWKKIRRGLSAGRVQSVTVRLILEREEEIKAFKAEEYWSLTAHLLKNNAPLTAALYSHNNKRYQKLDIKNQAAVDTIIKDLTDATYSVADLETKERKRSPLPPFTTSTLQQSAGNQLGFSSKRTMMIAQQLYEGINLGETGHTGLITYMRTDSLNLANEATQKAIDVIKNLFGPTYTQGKPRFYKSKSKGAQEAHEAIRPTDPSRTPDEIAAYLTGDQLKLYRLIWQRMIASQMNDAILSQQTITISAQNYLFRASGSTVIFDGFAKVLGAKAAFKEIVLPKVKKGDILDLDKLAPEQHFTQPPARYTEASLVKALEEHGIGRPSTYAPTIDTIQRREYVKKNEDKRFEPTEIGTIVTVLLRDHFPNIVDLEFTANMESDLDLIATGNKAWQPIIDAFYQPFHKDIQQKEHEIKKEDITQEKTGEVCPECQSELVIKLGRFGKFKACSNYPECKHTEPIGEDKKLEQELSGQKCPDCGKNLVVKRGRFGPFLGCEGYPDCKHIDKIETKTGAKCPKCKKGEIIEKKSRKGKTFYACNQYPKCENAYWSKPTGENCPQCNSLLVFGAKQTARCSNKECKFQKTLEE